MEEGVHALLVHQLGEAFRIGIHELDALLAAPLELFQQLVRLLVEATRIDADDVDFGNMRPDDVRQHHCLDPEAVGVDDLAVLLNSRLQRLADSVRLLFQL